VNKSQQNKVIMVRHTAGDFVKGNNLENFFKETKRKIVYQKKKAKEKI
jgi:hypothetical protein